MKKIRVISVIPARKGSKGLPNKNLVNINKKPLIYYSIKSSFKSNIINKTYVTSDSTKILNLASKMGCSILKRPPKYAGNKSTANQVIRHFLSEIKLSLNDIIIYLQPTSPCRNFIHIDKALKLFSKFKKPVISVTKNHQIILKSYLLSGHRLNSPYKKNYYNINRQDLPDTYKSNGAIYIFNKKQFLQANGFPNNDVIGYIMDKSESYDIDNKDHLKNVKEILVKNNTKYI